MSIPILLVLNIPVYLFIGWIVFDTKENAAETFYETIVSILKAIFIPSIVRVFMDDDDDEGFGFLPIVGFFVVCGLIVYGEYCLVQKYVMPPAG